MAKNTSSKQFLSQLNLLYFSQPAILMVFAAVVFTLVYSGSVIVNPDEGFAYTLTYVTAAVVVAGLGGAYYFFGTMLAKIDQKLPLDQKLPKYLAAILVRSAFLEAAGLFACIAFFLSAKTYLLTIPIIVAGIFILYRPTRSSIVEDLKLNSREEATFNS